MDSGPVAQFHVVVRGRCWLHWAEGETQLSGGDVVVFPFGHGHALVDEPGTAPIPGPAVLEGMQKGDHPFAEGGHGTTLLCGHFEFDRDLRHPLIEELPSLIHVRSMEREQPGWLETVAPILVRESGMPGPGADSIVDRLAEVLLIQVLRAHLLEFAPSQGFLAALADRRISRVLSIIHREAGHREGGTDLTLNALSRRAGMSRSSLAARFKALLGVAPMNYLAGWRMLIARDLLTSSSHTVAEAADAVGYASEAAFSRAFKRMFDENPGAVRRARSG